MDEGGEHRIGEQIKKSHIKVWNDRKPVQLSDRDKQEIHSQRRTN